jgi:hypothetical protein
VVYRVADRAIFLSGFAKNERAVIDADELATFRELAEGWLRADGASLDAQQRAGLAEELADEQDGKEN